MPVNRFAHSHAAPPTQSDDPDAPNFVYVSPERQAMNMGSELIHGAAPEMPGTVGQDYATGLMSQFGDASSAGTLMGVKPMMRPIPRPAPIQNPDIYIGGDAPQPAPARRPAPSTPNWAPRGQTTGVI